jgi:hypothetical protein
LVDITSFRPISVAPDHLLYLLTKIKSWSIYKTDTLEVFPSQFNLQNMA